MLSAKPYLKRERMLFGKLIILLICTLQHIVLSFSLLLIKGSLQNRAEAVDHSKVFKELPKLPVHDHYQWSISQSDRFMSWFYGSPYIKIYQNIDSELDYIVLKENEFRNKSAEIITFKITVKSLRRTAALLYEIIESAKRNKACIVSFKNLSHMEIPRSLHRVLSIMGFITKKSTLNCYVKAEDVFFHMKENIAYNHLFYIQY